MGSTVGADVGDAVGSGVGALYENVAMVFVTVAVAWFVMYTFLLFLVIL